MHIALKKAGSVRAAAERGSEGEVRAILESVKNQRL